MINDMVRNEVRTENMGEQRHLIQGHQDDLTAVDNVAFEEHAEEVKHIQGKSIPEGQTRPGGWVRGNEEGRIGGGGQGRAGEEVAPITHASWAILGLASTLNEAKNPPEDFVQGLTWSD